MRVSSLTIIAILLTLISTPSIFANTKVSNDVDISAGGNDTNVSVKIDNSINNSSNAQTTKNSSKTNIQIKQSGEGTSSVRINGKEWKVEDVGDISVLEETNQNRLKETLEQIINQLENLINKLKSLF